MIGAEGMEHICQSLPENTTLTRLNLTANAIGDKGAINLF